MKKKSILSLIIVGCVFCASCSNDITEVNETQSRDNTPLLTKMSTFNDSLLSTKPETRSAGRTLCAMSIVSADVISGYEGGKTAYGLCPKFMGPKVVIGVTALSAVVCGAWGSYGAGHAWGAWTRSSPAAMEDPCTPLRLMNAYAPIRAEESEKLIAENENISIKLDFPEETKELYSIGPKHNIVLKNLQENREISQDCKKYFTSEEIAFLESDEFIRANDSISHSVCRLMRNGEIPVTDGRDTSSLLMNLFSTLLAQYPDNADDVQFIINKYIEAVKNTKEIPDNEKELVYSALSVAASSYEYWTMKK